MYINFFNCLLNKFKNYHVQFTTSCNACLKGRERKKILIHKALALIEQQASQGCCFFSQTSNKCQLYAKQVTDVKDIAGTKSDAVFAYREQIL